MRRISGAYFYALLAILLWSTVAVAFKVALRYMDFIELLFISSLISTIILFGVLIFQSKFYLLFSFTPKQYFNSILLGFLNPFLYYLVLLKAYSILPAQLAQPLNYTWPVMLVLLSAPILKQKLHFRSILAIGISFIGVFFISIRGNFCDIKIEHPLGIVLASGSSVIWALFWILNVKDRRPEVEKLALSFFFSLFFTGLALLFSSEPIFPETKGLIAVIYVGFFEMGFTFILWLVALRKAGRSDKISNLVFISPFLSLIWIHLFLKEAIFYTTVAGLGFIISGIVVHQYKKLYK
jgi:drug/metabolite transporter (DMT)-like permease